MKKETIIILSNIFLVLIVIMLQFKYLEYDHKIKDMITNMDNVNDKIEKISNDKAIIEQDVQKNNQDMENIRLQLEKIEDDLSVARDKLNSL